MLMGTRFSYLKRLRLNFLSKVFEIHLYLISSNRAWVYKNLSRLNLAVYFKFKIIYQYKWFKMLILLRLIVYLILYIRIST